MIDLSLQHNSSKFMDLTISLNHLCAIQKWSDSRKYWSSWFVSPSYVCGGVCILKLKKPIHSNGQHQPTNDSALTKAFCLAKELFQNARCKKSPAAIYMGRFQFKQKIISNLTHHLFDHYRLNYVLDYSLWTLCSFVYLRKFEIILVVKWLRISKVVHSIYSQYLLCDICRL